MQNLQGKTEIIYFFKKKFKTDWSVSGGENIFILSEDKIKIHHPCSSETLRIEYTPTHPLEQEICEEKV